MAEALLRAAARQGGFEAHSAGTEAGRLHPLAVKAMAELGVDISMQQAKPVDLYAGAAFDYVVTVCDEAREACPVFANAKRQLHWRLPDPSAVTGSEAERLAAFRAVRDELRELVSGLIAQAGTATAD
jgi:arsenate reductase